MSATAQASAAFNPRQPFSRAEGRAAGLTAEMLLSRRFHKIFWDTYVAREVHITPLLRAKAVIRLVPSGSYISHHTAAELWGAARRARRPGRRGRRLDQGRHTSPERLIEAAAQWNCKGCRLARRAASLAREGVDSPQETRLRLLLVLAGLPEPRVNLIIRGGRLMAQAL